MFYLLKSSHTRQCIGDALLNLEQVEVVKCHEIPSKEDKDIMVYILKVWMKSMEDHIAVFSTLDEAKVVMKALLDNKIDAKYIDEFLPEKHEDCYDKDQSASRERLNS